MRIWTGNAYASRSAVETTRGAKSVPPWLCVDAAKWPSRPVAKPASGPAAARPGVARSPSSRGRYRRARSLPATSANGSAWYATPRPGTACVQPGGNSLARDCDATRCRDKSLHTKPAGFGHRRAPPASSVASDQDVQCANGLTPPGHGRDVGRVRRDQPIRGAGQCCSRGLRLNKLFPTRIRARRAVRHVEPSGAALSATELADFTTGDMEPQGRTETRRRARTTAYHGHPLGPYCVGSFQTRHTIRQHVPHCTPINISGRAGAHVVVSPRRVSTKPLAADESRALRESSFTQRRPREAEVLVCASCHGCRERCVVMKVSTDGKNPVTWVARGVGAVASTTWSAIVGTTVRLLPFTSKESTTDTVDPQQESLALQDTHPNSIRTGTDGQPPRGKMKFSALFAEDEDTAEGQVDDDGLTERLAARSQSRSIRGETTTSQAKLKENKSDSSDPQRADGPNKSKLPNKGAKAEEKDRRGGLFSLGRSSKNGGKHERRKPADTSNLGKWSERGSYGGLAQLRVVSLVHQALRRPYRSPLHTVLPYDIQRVLFTELQTVRPKKLRSGSKLEKKPFEPTVRISRDVLQPISADDPAFTQLANSNAAHTLNQVQRDIQTHDPTLKAAAGDAVEPGTSGSQTRRGGFFAFLWGFNRTVENKPELKDSRPHLTAAPSGSESYSPAQTTPKETPLSSNVGSADNAKTAALPDSALEDGESGRVFDIPLQLVGDLLNAVSTVRKQEVGPEDSTGSPSKATAAYAAAMTREANSMEEADLAGPGAAVSFAAASAMASSSAQSAKLDAVEAAGLHASVSAARAIQTVEDAELFVDAVGVQSLVTACRVLDGQARSSAMTALANIAILLPKFRVKMLDADGGSLMVSLRRAVLRSHRLGAAVSNVVDRESMLSETEALVSGTHLLGSVALAREASAVAFRRELANDADVVRALERIAGGVKAGKPEGAARAARRALGALGINVWKPRVAGQRGLRVLCIDGGGTRAIMAFETLKHLKQLTGCEIHELFDVIGGTSTGAIVAASLGIAHKTVEEVEALYRRLIGKIFAKHPVNGPKMLLTRAYYDTRVLESTLKEECGTGVFIDSLAEESTNKVLVVSSIMSRSPKELHVFRNYTYPDGHESRYEGTTEAQLWEALRASSAAPTFFSEIEVNGELHADGAIVANNPTAVALHETKCMYPGVPIEVVVSIGNGRSLTEGDLSSGLVASDSVPPVSKEVKAVGWGDVVGSIVASATSTESVHHALSDLFPESRYFRFNPVTLSDEIDETHPDKLADFVNDAKRHIDENHKRFDEVARILRPEPNVSIWRRFRNALEDELAALSSDDDDLFVA